MAKTVGYMLTWTTYGTWLQGEKKGFVKDGEVMGENTMLKQDCRDKLTRPPVRLHSLQATTNMQGGRHYRNADMRARFGRGDMIRGSVLMFNR